MERKVGFVFDFKFSLPLAIVTCFKPRYIVAKGEDKEGIKSPHENQHETPTTQELKTRVVPVNYLPGCEWIADHILTEAWEKSEKEKVAERNKDLKLSWEEIKRNRRHYERQEVEEQLRSNKLWIE